MIQGHLSLSVPVPQLSKKLTMDVANGSGELGSFPSLSLVKNVLDL